MTDLKEKSKRVVANVPEVFSLERLEISERIITELVAVMNHIHQVNYPYRFWKIIMADYVNALISIKHILEEEELKRDPYLFPLNSHHLPTFKQKIISRAPSVIKHYKHPGTRSHIFQLLHNENNITIGLPDIEAVRKDTGGVDMPVYYPLFPGRGNTAKRKRAEQLALQYNDLFLRNMIKQLPRVYVEYLDGLLDKIPVHNPEQKIFHTHGLPSFYNSLVIAKYLNKGAKLYCYQHGAFYGEMVGHNSHFNECSVADEFRSWGWVIKKNDVPWQAYRLEKFRLLYNKCIQSNEYDFLMCYPDVFYANYNFFKEITDLLLQKLDEKKYKKFMARPRPLNKMFSHAGRLSFIKDNRVFIDSGLSSMAEVTAKSKMVIQFTIPATNFFECLYVNHPTIGLLDNDQPTDNVKPYYDFFIEQGVMHLSFESLVAHLNKINIHEWWSYVIQQPMYQQFKNEFLREVK
jgi:hypothetical protein